MRYTIVLTVATVFLFLLTGCPCGTPLMPVELTPYSGLFGYGLTGPYNFEGSLTKENLTDAEWTLSGMFHFPSPGYTVLGPSIEVMESSPEQVRIRLRVLLPKTPSVLPVIDSQPVGFRIAASNQASFDIAVQEYCVAPPPSPPGPDCAAPVTIAVIPESDSQQEYRVSGMRFEGTLHTNGPEMIAVPVWRLTGTFTFPTGGYRLLEPEILVAESYPEQVTVTLGYVAPSGPAIQIIVQEPVDLRIGTFAPGARFTIRVKSCTEGSSAHAAAR